MACLTVLDGTLKGQRVSLDQPVTRIGRRDGNDWVLADGSVSGTHCEIEKNESGFLIRDLGSTNGTKVNNEPVKEKPLFRNDILMFGDVPVMIEGDDVPVGTKTGPLSIPRTTIVIHPNKKAEPPKEFTKKSNSNKIWIAIIAILLVVIGYLLFLFLRTASSEKEETQPGRQVKSLPAATEEGAPAKAPKAEAKPAAVQKAAPKAEAKAEAKAAVKEAAAPAKK